MNPKLRRTITVFHISAIIYFLLGIVTPILFYMEFRHLVALFFGSFLALFSIGIGVFVEIVIKGLKKGKFWAWVAGIVISGIYIPSLFIILGIIGLIGLVNEETRKAFIKK